MDGWVGWPFGRYVVKAKAFVDATGDGRLGAEAGAEWIQGREGYAK